MTSGLDFDPYELDSWIGKVVSVCGSSGKRHLGRLIAIDPVSSSVVVLIKLANESQKKQEIALIPWIDLAKLSVVSEDVAEDDVDIDEIRLELLKDGDKEELKVDAQEVKHWLEKHQIEVSLDNEDTLSIHGGLVKLRPPYLTENSCIEASNVIVLDRVTSILAQMPASGN